MAKEHRARQIIHLDMGGSGPAVLMVHGFADSTYCWHKNVKPLMDEGFRVVLVDQPGLGRSDIPPEGYVFSVAAQASAVLRVADALNLTAFHIVGSSMGGGISLYMSIYHPERIQKAKQQNPWFYTTGHRGVRPSAAPRKTAHRQPDDDRLPGWKEREFGDGQGWVC